MKTPTLVFLGVTSAISVAFAAPHHVPLGANSSNQSSKKNPYANGKISEKQNLGSVHRLGSSGLISHPMSNRLAQDVLQADQRAKMANELTKSSQSEQSGSGPQVQVQESPSNLPQNGQLPGHQKTANQPSWRLEGVMSGGEHSAEAVFNYGNDYPVVLHAGEKVDRATKIVSISRNYVVLEVHKHRVVMMPW